MGIVGEGAGGKGFSGDHSFEGWMVKDSDDEAECKEGSDSHIPGEETGSWSSMVGSCIWLAREGAKS